ncbi:hypothetical protein [Streptomyces sp. NPDC126514]
MTYKAVMAGLDFGGGKSVIALGRDTELTAGCARPRSRTWAN